MTVGELIVRLSEMDLSATVILQKDPEGNGYSQCEGVEEVSYADGEISDFEPLKPHCVVLYPI